MDKEIKILLKNPTIYLEKVKANILEKLLVYISDLYYNTEAGSPISDTLFDELKDKLLELNPKSKFLKQVGAPIKEKALPKVTLPYYMGSLDKIKPEKNTLDSWLTKHIGPYIVSDKLDGVSALLYKKDDIIKMYTRGNGSVGQNITHLIPYVFNSKVDFKNMPNGYAIRGELIITKNDFKKIEDIMANARNAVAGLVNSKVGSINKKVAGITKFIAYAILSPELKQQYQMIELEKYKLNVVDYNILKKLSIENLGELLVNRKKESEYEIDGLVVIDSSQIYKVRQENPTYGFAYKQIMEDQIVEAEVVQIIWQPSMDGYLKPRIEIKPIKLGGVEITYATGFNAKFIVDNVIGKGAIIKLIRSGDVIPYVLDVIKIATSKKPDLPAISYVWNETDVDIILNDIHSDAYNNVNVRKMLHFFKTLGIEYIGEGVLTKLVQHGYNTVFKIFEAESAEIIKIDGLGEKIYNKIFESIGEKLLNTTLATLMTASRCFERGLGERKIKLITDVYPNILDNKWKREEFIQNIIDIDGFDTKTATLFVNNFNNFLDFYKQINNFYDLSYLTNTKQIKKGTKFENQIIVFTGFRDDELEKYIAGQGGKVSSSVSGKTTMLVYAGDTTSSKYEEAVKKGITIMTKDEFIKKYK